jgi:hypothetical protein
MHVEFHDENGGNRHDDFQAWRQANPSGYFLAVASRNAAMLHGSRCHHLGDSTWSAREYRKSLTSFRKVVAASESELREWAGSRKVRVSWCQHCVRDGLLRRSISTRRQNVAIPDGISSQHILTALADLDTDAHHEFGESTGYDVLHQGRRYPPKAVIGLAAGKILGKPLGPYDFKGGLTSKCFRILRANGSPSSRKASRALSG